jgi:hypothetical protein
MDAAGVDVLPAANDALILRYWRATTPDRVEGANRC